MVRGRGLLLASLALCISACGGSVPASATGQPSPTASASLPAPVTSESPFPTDDAFAALVGRVAGGDHPVGSGLDVFWQATLAGRPLARPYAAPTSVRGYHGDVIPDSPCATGTVSSYWHENAHPCEKDGSILYDETWLRSIHTRVGQFAPAMILAHEWGHLAQAALDDTDAVTGTRLPIGAELGADCFAGMYLANTERIAPNEFSIGGDVEAALVTLFEKGNPDYSVDSWFQADEHGSSSQRIMAAGTGYLSPFDGLPWCAGYAAFRPRDVVDLGRYRLLNLPGRPAQADGDGWYVIPPLSSLGQESTIRLAWVDALPLPGQGATAAQLHALWHRDFPDVQPLEDPTPLSGLPTGTAVAQYFFASDGGGGTSDTSKRSGYFGIASPVDGVGGLVIVSERAKAPPAGSLDAAEIRTIDEQFSGVNQVLRRLCGPDDSGDPADPNLNVACAVEKQ